MGKKIAKPTTTNMRENFALVRGIKKELYRSEIGKIQSPNESFVYEKISAIFMKRN